MYAVKYILDMLDANTDILSSKRDILVEARLMSVIKNKILLYGKLHRNNHRIIDY